MTGKLTITVVRLLIYFIVSSLIIYIFNFPNNNTHKQHYIFYNTFTFTVHSLKVILSIRQADSEVNSVFL